LTVYVVKASGETEPLDLNKVKKACLRAGVTQETAEKVAHQVLEFAHDGISTREIYGKVFELLKKSEYPSALKFRLKEAIMRMGPSGFPFENFVSEIMKQHGYRTRIRQNLRGACANHEVDIIVEEDLPAKTMKYLVECKYHNASGIYTGLKEVLYTYARLLDLNEGSEKGFCEHLDGAWLVTNTKISIEGEKYGECKGLRLIGWRYPPEKGLEKLIEEKTLYPITILESVDKNSLDKLSKAGVILLKHLSAFKPEILSKKTDIKLRKILKMLDDLKKVEPLK
jgi:hypothetical protein